MPNAIDAASLSLLTDLYQITMGYGYWKNKMHERRSVFHLFFRRPPFGGQYAIAAGLEPAVQWLTDFKITDDDASYLKTLVGNDGQPLFSNEFIAAITGMQLNLDIDAIPEGTVVFAHEPLLRVTGPLWQCQWVETALLNIINFQTLIATKSSRVCDAARGEPVLEFGLRRAQGIDGALAASRAAYIGGCSATSNVLAGRMFDIPVKGTHAHSWVMSFDDEASAFNAYADAMPNNCVFLVDTYDTIEGVRRAIEVGNRLREQGHEMVGVRLDSGDLAELSIGARKLLDEAGFADAVIVASNDLDEQEIEKLKSRGATIAVWGVGTNLVTARDQPALGGVYKLAAIENDQGEWLPRIKLSELPIKTSTPGILQVKRFFQDHQMIGDVIYSELLAAPESSAVAFDGSGSLDFADSTSQLDMLVPVIRDGKVVYDQPSIHAIRDRAAEQRATLPPGSRKLAGGESYPVGLEESLSNQKLDLIRAARE